MGIHFPGRGSVLVGVLVVLAAGGCASTGASQTPSVPSANPTASAPTASPSPSPTPTPTLTLAPTAVPTPPPFDVVQLVADFTSGAVAKNYPAVSATKVESSYKTLSQKDPALVTAVGVQGNWTPFNGGKAIDASNLELCLNRVAGEDNTNDVTFGCELLMTNLISYSNKTGDASAVEFTKSVIGYCVHPLYASGWNADAPMIQDWIQALQKLEKAG